MIIAVNFLKFPENPEKTLKFSVELRSADGGPVSPNKEFLLLTLPHWPCLLITRHREWPKFQGGGIFEKIFPGGGVIEPEVVQFDRKSRF